MSDEAKKIEAAMKAVVDDPESIHREVIADLIKERGEQWVAEHRHELEWGWAAAKFIFFGL